jgi:hypothetical protein
LWFRPLATSAEVSTLPETDIPVWAHIGRPRGIHSFSEADIPVSELFGADSPLKCGARFSVEAYSAVQSPFGSQP